MLKRVSNGDTIIERAECCLLMPIACRVTMSCLRWIDHSTGKRAVSTGKPGVGGCRPVGVDGSASKAGESPNTTEQRLG
jgi:hypothetical protein